MVTLVDAKGEADLLERTRAVVPELRERAPTAIEDRKVPAENVASLRRAGSFKALQSTRNGGFGLSMRAHLDTVATLAEGCGSTAWCAGVIQAHSWLLSHFLVETQDEIYGTDADAVVAAVIAPRGRAELTRDGYLLSGFWPFASANHNADWILLGAAVVDENNAVIDEGQFAVPTSAITRHDDWHVSGLTGTGSNSVSVEGLEVPAHRFLSMQGVRSNQGGPGTDAQHPDDWNQYCAAVPVLALALTGSAIGIARQAMADFTSLIEQRTIAYTSNRQAEHPVTHVQVGEAAMLAHEGELILYHCADQIDQAGRTGTELDLATRARMRLDCATGVRRSLEAVEILVRASGSSGLQSDGPLARAVSDLRAINQHAMLNQSVTQELYGRVVLGLEPNSLL